MGVDELGCTKSRGISDAFLSSRAIYTSAICGLVYLHYGLFLETHPGQWEIKYNEKNLAGKRLWHAVTSRFKTEVCHLNDEETVQVFTSPKD